MVNFKLSDWCKAKRGGHSYVHRFSVSAIKWDLATPMGDKYYSDHTYIKRTIIHSKLIKTMLDYKD